MGSLFVLRVGFKTSKEENLRVHENPNKRRVIASSSIASDLDSKKVPSISKCIASEDLLKTESPLNMNDKCVAKSA